MSSERTSDPMRRPRRGARAGALATLLLAAGCADSSADSLSEPSPAKDDATPGDVGGPGTSFVPGPSPQDATAPGPRLLVSEPKDGDPAFYPVEVYDQGGGQGVGERRVLRFRFDVPMATDRKTVRFETSGRALEGTWSEDAKTLQVELRGVDGTPPLDAEKDYDLDLGALASSTGESPGAPHVRFRTAARDELIEHACIHTMFGPYDAAIAGSEGAALTPMSSIGTVHRQFSLSLPNAGGSFAGDLRVRFSGSGARTYLLLLDAAASIALTDAEGGAVAVVTQPTVMACPGIRQQSTVTLARSKDYRLRIAGSTNALVKAVWETQ